MGQKEESNVISGQEFDEPLILQGQISGEPERYVAEKPYELTKYEFTLLRKSFFSDVWFQLFAGGFVGLLIAILGKSISALLDKKTPNFERWELYALGIGLLFSILFKFLKSKEDKEKRNLENVIEGHFKTNKPRRVHLTQGGINNEN